MTQFDAATGLAAGTFGFGTYRRESGPTFPGLVLPGGAIFDVSERYPDTQAIFEDWDRAFDWMADRAARPGREDARFESVHKLPVVARPNILGTGANYRQHVAEMMTHNAVYQHLRRPDESVDDFFQRNLAAVDARARDGMPFFWTGLHSALSGADDDIVLPVIGESPDWELELGILTRATGRNLSPEEADDLIAAYVMVNDLGLVDQARRTDVQFEWDWISKSQPGFFTTGPYAVPKQFVDLAEARIELKVNGEVMQDWPVDDMIFGPDRLVAYATERVRLVPGDLIIAGSPPGNGASHGGKWLQPGDVVDGSVSYLGRIRNRVVAEDTDGRTPTFGPVPTTGRYGA